MKNKRYIVYFLFLISIIMLAVPAIPHHHHANGVICMKSDVPADTPCPAHHHADNDTCCSDECLTRFDSPTPSIQADNGPHYVLVAILFTDLIRENVLAPREKCLEKYDAYRENLHSTVISRASGLRAPPTAA